MINVKATPENICQYINNELETMNQIQQKLDLNNNNHLNILQKISQHVNERLDNTATIDYTDFVDMFETEFMPQVSIDSYDYLANVYVIETITVFDLLNELKNADGNIKHLAQSQMNDLTSRFNNDVYIEISI